MNADELLLEVESLQDEVNRLEREVEELRARLPLR